MLQGRGVNYDSMLPERLAELLGQPIPLFLQLLTQDLYRFWKRRPSEDGGGRCSLTIEDLEHVFGEFIRSSAAQDKLQHFYSRIQRYYAKPSDSAAYALLSQLSLKTGGMSRQNLFQEYERVVSEQGTSVAQHEKKRMFNQLLRDLENDFYVAETSDDQYDFASGVMKAWWRKYYA